MQFCVRPSNDGFFTNFVVALDWLAFGEEHGVHVGIDWRVDAQNRPWDFAYVGSESTNVWTSYFAPVPCAAGDAVEVSRWITPHLGGFRGYALYNDVGGIRLRDECLRLHSGLKRHVCLLPDVAARIDGFAKDNFPGKGVLIGVHLRNPASTNHIYCRIPPLSAYCDRIDEVVRSLAPGTEWQIFAASDVEGLIEALARRYPSRVISQSGITRAKPGTPQIHMRGHSSSALGLEVVTDCWLLAKCHYLIGVHSGVCTSVCAINPDIAFVNAQPLWNRIAGRLEYEIKKLYCDLFEPAPPALQQALSLIADRKVGQP